MELEVGHVPLVEQFLIIFRKASNQLQFHIPLYIFVVRLQRRNARRIDAVYFRILRYAHFL